MTARLGRIARESAERIATLEAELERQRARAEKLEKALRELIKAACGYGDKCPIPVHAAARAALAAGGAS